MKKKVLETFARLSYVYRCCSCLVVTCAVICWKNIAYILAVFTLNAVPAIWCKYGNFCFRLARLKPSYVAP